MDKLDRLTKSQAAVTAGLGERSIDRAIAAGELVAAREHGRILIARTELERWIAARQTPAPARIAAALITELLVEAAQP